MTASNILSNYIVSQKDAHKFNLSSSIQQSFWCRTKSKFGSQKTEALYNYSLYNPMIQG